MVVSRAAKSESRPELESVGVDRFARSRESELGSLNFAVSDSGLESQDTNCQLAMILPERLYIVPKTLQDRKKWSGGVEIKLHCHLMIEFRLIIKDSGANFGVTEIVA